MWEIKYVEKHNYDDEGNEIVSDEKTVLATWTGGKHRISAGFSGGKY